MKKTARVLIVDDDRDGAESLADLVAVFGYESRVAFSGEDAVNAAVHENFDVTFMDLHMPGMNGIEACQRIRRTKPDARVVLITGVYDSTLLGMLANDGIFGVLQKPIDVREVLRVIEGASL